MISINTFYAFRKMDPEDHMHAKLLISLIAFLFIYKKMFANIVKHKIKFKLDLLFVRVKLMGQREY